MRRRGRTERGESAIDPGREGRASRTRWGSRGGGPARGGRRTGRPNQAPRHAGWTNIPDQGMKKPSSNEVDDSYCNPAKARARTTSAQTKPSSTLQSSNHVSARTGASIAPTLDRLDKAQSHSQPRVGRFQMQRVENNGGEEGT